MENIVTVCTDKVVAKFSLLGAELVSLKIDGKERIWQGDERFWTGHAPVLFPLCGGLKDDTYFYNGKAYTLKKHGFARREYFAVYNKTENSVTFLLKENENTLKGYPFKFNFYVTYTFNDKLTVTYKVENTDFKEMYFSVGSHEAYLLEGDLSEYSVAFSENENLDANVLDGNLLTYNTVCIGKNVKELPLTYDYFKVDALVFKDIKSRKVSLMHKGKEFVTVDFAGFNHLLFWTKPNSGYFCIEPWITLPDMVDTNQKIEDKPDNIKLASGKTYSISHIITFK